MSVLSLPATGHTEVYVSGDVSIDETAAIAPGVILQATAQARIVIKAGACIGMGTILTANQGTIEIGEGAVLGSGVLMVGYGKIGDRACVSSATTIVETSVEEMAFISPGTLLGDSSRQADLEDGETSQQQPSHEPETNGASATANANVVGETSNNYTRSKSNGDFVNTQAQRAFQTPHQNQFAGQPPTNPNGSPSSPSSKNSQAHPNGAPSSPSSENNQAHPNGASSSPSGENRQTDPNGSPSSFGESSEANHSDDQQVNSEQDSSSNDNASSNHTIYGQTHIERLMVTLFPHKQQFKKPK